MSNNIDIEQILRNVYNHPLINSEDLSKIIKSHQIISIKKNDYFLQSGKISNEYGIVISGLLRSFVYDYNRNDITTNFFISSEIVIQTSSLFQRIPSKENIQAITNCEIVIIDFHKFQELFHEIESFREWGRSWMVSQLFELNQRILSIHTDSAKDRYDSLLREKPEVFQYAPLKNIASYLGITESSLSRIRKQV